jgi:DNA topoisomerase-1
MPKHLVVVESPTKAKTISRYLGSSYVVRASMGHVRDLPPKELGVDLTTFDPTYETSSRNGVVTELRSAARGADDILLATDPDREGEAIAWHVRELLKPRVPVRRLEFHEITKTAIDAAIAHPRQLNHALIDAQQARRVLDRLVGYQLSPLLWSKVKRGISAGRVQSVAVRLICEREREIQNFVKVEFWQIEAQLRKQTEPREPFMAELMQIAGKKPELHSESATNTVVAELKRSQYQVRDVDKRPVRRTAAPPFTTSTLQQAAAHRLGMSAKRTMIVAQQLYEGIDLGPGGQVGLITYMRTDSVNLADSAITAARDYIRATYGDAYLPDRPVRHKTKAKGAQEAHEAIRPTEPGREPNAVRQFLDADQFRLYQLIWQRMIASQMSAAVSNRTTVNIDATPASGPQGKFLLRAVATQLTFNGFLAIYGINADEQAEEPRDENEGFVNSALPPLTPAELLDLLKLLPSQHFTEPPPRYSEASLVKTLEKEGIGRPSTYATILSTIQDRGYVEKQGKTFVPTPLGFATNDLLVEHFGDIVETGFTARLEDQLDEVADGERDWKQLLREFHGPFAKRLQEKKDIPRASIPRAPAQPTGEVCPNCGSPMVQKAGRFGPFEACSNYPTCRYIKREPKAERQPPEKTGVPCPVCHEGELVKRMASKGRSKGTAFYGCSRYPKCKAVVPELPEPGQPAVAAVATPPARRRSTRTSTTKSATTPTRTVRVARPTRGKVPA